jgi:phosphotransferase system  glucose/maltose/N-acetylglucosamine-specific IIC component
MISALLILALHIYTFVDAFNNINKSSNGVLLIMLVFIPVVGPVIYFLFKIKRLESQQDKERRKFMQGKKFLH